MALSTRVKGVEADKKKEREKLITMKRCSLIITNQAWTIFKSLLLIQSLHQLPKDKCLLTITIPTCNNFLYRIIFLKIGMYLSNHSLHQGDPSMELYRARVISYQQIKTSNLSLEINLFCKINNLNLISIQFTINHLRSSRSSNSRVTILISISFNRWALEVLGQILIAQLIQWISSIKLLMEKDLENCLRIVPYRIPRNQRKIKDQQINQTMNLISISLKYLPMREFSMIS